eukprot:TRINITY_DN1760_c0_g1_i1.p1 TRINITY_DN1760_c0_g1~~TRINITY_DN1760_c0_g1_i1.p1  ORF type:complete len:281 (+),score=61.84 TRINITY_DN1760_c0_g1_i1:31-843(+)
MKAVLLCVLLSCLCSAILAKDALGWMCLERCHRDVQAGMNEVHSHFLSGDLSIASYENYDCWDGGKLIYNTTFTDVHATIQGWGMGSYPMITTARIDRLRPLWQADVQKKFIDDAIAYITKFDYSGFNVDFEPEPASSVDCASDPQKYISFLSHFAESLHKINKKLTVDIASWSCFWDFAALASTSVDKFLTMDTYATSWCIFSERMKKAINAFGVERVGVGLISQTIKNESLWDMRFDLMNQYGVKEVDIWDIPAEDTIWKHVSAWMKK